ncbi:hypothetical protein JCM8547_004573 [Rhodosporidiobolus lusitaniae]
MRSILLSLSVFVGLALPTLATSTFYHYPCSLTKGGVYSGDDALCKKGWTSSSGLIVPYDMHCAFDDGGYYCGAKSATCIDYNCAHGLICKRTRKGKKCVSPTPQPSGKVTKRDDLSSSERRSFLCPGDQVACPLTGTGTLGYECIDLNNNIEQCGGCAAFGGTDCSSIEGADAVLCHNGSCKVLACGAGYSYHVRKGCFAR